MESTESKITSRPSLRECANFAAWTIKKVCKDIGPRPAGSQQELDAQNFMAKQVGKAADEVNQEEFTVARKAFFGWFKISGVVLSVATVCFILGIYIASLILSLYVASMLLFEFVMYKKYVDWMFKKYTSHNTMCVRKPQGEVKRRIIFGGHSDSVFEWRFHHIGGAPLLYFNGGYPAVGLGFLLIFNIVKMVQAGGVVDFINPDWISWLSLAFIPGYVMFFMWANFNRVVEGANDNLSGCMVAAAVLKYLDDNNIRFENTEVVAMFSGSEEPGLRGAKYWAEQHKKECEDVETMFVALDTFHDFDDMFVYDRDLSGTVKHNPRCCALMQKAGEIADKKMRLENIFIGASDAAAITQAGIPACALAAMNPGPPKYYHTRDDNASNLSLKTIEKGIEICVEAAFIFDEKGLCDNY